MIQLILLFVVCTIFSRVQAQTNFIFTFPQSESDLIVDVAEDSQFIYLLQNRAFNISPPYDFSSFSDILILSKQGELLSIIPVHNAQSFYHRIVSIDSSFIYLLGHLKSDTCKSKMVISKFNKELETIEHISTKDFCSGEIQKIKLIQGVGNKLIAEEYHSQGHGLAKHYYYIDSLYQFSLAMDSVPLWTSLSVDFSRKGYLISDYRFKDFYSKDFDYVKYRWFNIGLNSWNETHFPFGKNLILLESLQPESLEDNFGFQTILIDSNMNIKSRTVFAPVHYYSGSIYSPWYGGLEIKNENEIWESGYVIPTVEIDSGYFFIAKMDSLLQIECQHFVGFDSWYRLYGLRTLPSGGAVVFGTRLRDDGSFPYGADVFAMRVGQNCELPTTSVQNGDYVPIFSISAYPNPGSNDLTFSAQGFDPSQLRVELINEAGQILFSRTDLTSSLTLPDLPAGQYFYHIFEKQKHLGIGAWVKQ